MIYHICKKSDWENSAVVGVYRADTLDSEGFIHCSTSAQVLRVLNSFYKGQQGLVLLAVELSHLVSQVKWEPGLDKPDELFPHVFGPINTNAIEKVIELENCVDGNFEIPPIG